MELVPFFARVIVRAEPLNARLKTSLIIPDQAKDRDQPEQGEIVAVGPTVEADIKVGQKVLWGKYAAKKIPWAEDLWLMNEEDLLGAIHE